ERRAAARAGLADGPRPERELARRVVGAGEERLPAPGPSLDELAAAVGLRARDPEGERLGRLALRVARAGDELPEAPVLDDHGLPAGRAGLVGRLGGGRLPRPRPNRCGTALAARRES